MVLGHTGCGLGRTGSGSTADGSHAKRFRRRCCSIFTLAELYGLLLGSTIDRFNSQLGSASLLASNLIANQQQVLSTPLPDSQWQAEVANWFAMTLNFMQRNSIAISWVPSQSFLLGYSQPWESNDTVAQDWCVKPKSRRR